MTPSMRPTPLLAWVVLDKYIRYKKLISLPDYEGSPKSGSAKILVFWTYLNQFYFIYTMGALHGLMLLLYFLVSL